MVGPSEKALMAYLAENPNKRNSEIAEALNEERSNITHRLYALGKKKKLVEATKTVNEQWRLSVDGIGYIIISEDVKIDIDKTLSLYANIYEEIKVINHIKEAFKVIKFRDYDRAMKDIISRCAQFLYSEDWNDEGLSPPSSQIRDDTLMVFGYIRFKYMSKMSRKNYLKFLKLLVSFYGEDKTKEKINKFIQNFNL